MAARCSAVMRTGYASPQCSCGTDRGGIRSLAHAGRGGTEGGSRPISRVLSWAVIHLGRTSPYASCDLPGSPCGPQVTAPILRPGRMLPYLVLLRVGFTVPPRVATGAVRSYRTFSPLPPARRQARRFVFCGTFRGLAPPRRYLAPCPMEPGLSSPPSATMPCSQARLPGRLPWLILYTRWSSLAGESRSRHPAHEHIGYPGASSTLIPSCERAPIERVAMTAGDACGERDGLLQR